jgi:hypothetical protein
MPYEFIFDLTPIPITFFNELSGLASSNRIQRKLGWKTQRLAHRLTQFTGLDEPATRQLVEDLLDVYAKNLSERERFECTRKRALLLPHCSRKFMDNRCQATFDHDVPTYVCRHCSEDCLINKATRLGERKGYRVYVLPGGSCLLSILKREKYEGIVGVACGQEMMLGAEGLRQMGFAGQAVPLIRNGCSNTSFDMESLEETL